MARVITTILLDDNPKGFRLIKIGNWSGMAFVVPRSKLKEFKERPEVAEHGLYFLFGEGKEKPAVYIGQSSNVASRLTSHDAERSEEEWNEAFVFVKALDSTLIKYLESKAIHFAVQAKRYEFLNGNIPQRLDVPEEHNIVASEYFENIKLIIELSGYPVFTDPYVRQPDSEFYTFRVGDAFAIGRMLETQEFLIYKDSTARVEEVKSFAGSGHARRRRLIDEGVLALNDRSGLYVFTMDYLFTSPSAAADTVAARSSNGWTSWKDEKGNTLDENIRK